MKRRRMAIAWILLLVLGEEKEHYYHFTGERPYPVVSYSRKLASECAGFDPVQYATWCVGQGRDALIK